MSTSFYNKDELKNIGLKSYGKNVLISKKASIYGASDIVLGNNVRIDDFALLSGHIEMEDYTHVGAYSCLFAGDSLIKFEEFASTSSNCAIYAISDDYTGEMLANPTVPEKYKKINKKPVYLRKYALIGTGSKILPGSDIAIGTAVGAMSLITKPTLEWKVYFGIPAKPIKNRKKNLIKIEEQLKNEYIV